VREAIEKYGSPQEREMLERVWGPLERGGHEKDQVKEKGGTFLFL
jgi:hypothetical protein